MLNRKSRIQSAVKQDVSKLTVEGPVFEVHLLQRFRGHLQVVVLLRFREFGEVHQARMLPLIIIPDLGAKSQKQHFHHNPAASSFLSSVTFHHGQIMKHGF